MTAAETFALVLALGFAGLATSAVIALRYFAACGVFDLVTRRARSGLYAGLGKQIGTEIRWSLMSALIYGVPVGIVWWGYRHHGWTQVYTDWNALPLWYAPLSAFLYLFAHDTWFYWTHRVMHRPAVFRRAHAIHHKGKSPTAWTAMSFHPIEALTGALVIPALVLLVPIHVVTLAMVISIMTLMGITNHLGWEIYPRRLVHSPLGNWLITASHHERHHEDYQCNFGLYFRFWDRLCATDRGFSKRLAESAMEPQSAQG